MKEMVVADSKTIQTAEPEDLYRRLRRRLTDWVETRQGRGYRYADRLLLLPDFVHLMIRLGLDRRVPRELRTQAAAALAYVALPIDLMPEGLIGPLGFGDDLLLMVLVIRRLLASVPSEVVLSHWAGPVDLLRTLQGLLAIAEDMIGKRLWRRLQRVVGGSAVEESFPMGGMER
ncbi:MAG: YkvA family protein [Thermoanaerobaculales bacterium]